MAVHVGGRGPGHMCRTPRASSGGIADNHTASLIDNFNDNSIDAAKWVSGQFFDTSVSTGATVAEQTSRLEVIPLASQAAATYGGLVSVSSWDLTGSSVFVKVGGGAASPQRTYLTVGGGSTTSLYRVYAQTGALVFQRVISTLGTNLVSLGYSAATHAWWRIRESGGTIFFDTATNTASNPPIEADWTNRASEVINTTALPDKTQVKIGIGAGTSSTMASPATSIFDGFNTAT